MGEIEIEGRLVVWDDNKDEINRQKHNVAFEDAARVFLDENRIDFPDEKHSIEEDRSITIGRVGKILFVVYTERDDKTRLISARKANKNERSKYYYGNAVCL
mgnify:CR=1 FL=1